MKPTLLILAAGMGSRYGGLKQLDEMGPNGETIMDYSIFDAKKAGFGKIVFVIRRDFEEAFKQKFVDKLSKYIEIEYVFQELNELPNSFKVPDNREKPWGTNHAVWVARKVINEPFAVINADDFYGQDAFKVMSNYLTLLNLNDTDYCMVGYKLTNTLSEFGSVNRGVCEIDENNCLVSVTEREGLKKLDNEIVFNNNSDSIISKNSLVSMNMWGFSPFYFNQTEKDFEKFLEISGAELKSEFYIPTTITNLINNKKAIVKVLSTDAEWFGVTYKEDKPQSIEKVNSLIKAGVYPEKLWK